MNKLSGIYSIKCITTGHIFVGVTEFTSLESMYHQDILSKGEHTDSKLQELYDKYGWHSFMYSVKDIMYDITDPNFSITQHIEEYLLKAWYTSPNFSIEVLKLSPHSSKRHQNVVDFMESVLASLVKPTPSTTRVIMRHPQRGTIGLTEEEWSELGIPVKLLYKYREWTVIGTEKC